LKKLFIALLFASSVNIAFAETVTVDFNAAQPAGFDLFTPFTNYTEDGYMFTPSNTERSDALVVFGPRDFRYAGSPAMSIGYGTQTVTLTRIDNQLFDLTSIDLASYYTPADIPSITSFDLTFTGTLADNSLITQTVTIQNTNTFSTYNFTVFKDLKNVTWAQSGTLADRHEFDNLVLSSVTPVPEPETYALFLAGFGLMGFAARRKKRLNFLVLTI